MPEKTILRAFALPLYGISGSYTESSVTKHLTQALDLNVLCSREKLDGEYVKHNYNELTFCRVVYKLSTPAASFEPPIPPAVSQLLEKDGKELDVVMIWQFAMTYVGGLGMLQEHQGYLQSSAARSLTFSQLMNSLMSKEILAVYEAEVIEALVELFILRGVIYEDNNLLKLNPGDACPVDFASKSFDRL